MTAVQEHAPVPGATAMNFDAIAREQQATGTNDELAAIGATLQIVGEPVAEAADIRASRKNFNFRYRFAALCIRFFRDSCGPTPSVFSLLDGDSRARLAGDIASLLGRLNVGGRDSLVVPGEYLEVVVRKRQRGTISPPDRRPAKGMGAEPLDRYNPRSLRGALRRATWPARLEAAASQAACSNGARKLLFHERRARDERRT